MRSLSAAWAENRARAASGAIRARESFIGISGKKVRKRQEGAASRLAPRQAVQPVVDRKSTRLNSSHLVISYAVFCLKKKKKTQFAYATEHRHIVSFCHLFVHRVRHL